MKTDKREQARALNNALKRAPADIGFYRCTKCSEERHDGYWMRMTHRECPRSPKGHFVFVETPTEPDDPHEKATLWHEYWQQADGMLLECEKACDELNALVRDILRYVDEGVFPPDLNRRVDAWWAEQWQKAGEDE